MGVHIVELDGFIFRAIGNVIGQPISGDVMDETGAQQAYIRGHELIDRCAYGTQASFVRVRRDATGIADLREMDWVLDARSWRPNYTSGDRGGNHIAQIVSIKDISPVWREMRIVDAAPYANPIGQPTLGTVVGDAAGVVSVPISAVPAGGQARVDYAVSPTVPDTTSSLWTFLGRTVELTTLQSPPLEAATTVWIRARGEKEGRRPSAWTTPVSVVLAGTPIILDGRISISSVGVPTITWVANASTGGVKVLYQVHLPNVLVSPTTFVSADVDDGQVVLPIALRPGEWISVDIQGYTGWTGSAVSGTAGQKFRVESSRPADANSRRVLDITYKGPTGDEERLYGSVLGALVEMVDIHWAIFPDPLPADWEAQLLAEANFKTTLVANGEEFVTADPGHKELLRGAALARSLENGKYVAADIPFYFGAEGTEPPIFLSDPIFTEAADGLTSVVSVDVAGDPRGVISSVWMFLTVMGLTTGPFALSLAGATYSTSFTLHPLHNTYVQLRVDRNDGGDSLWLGPFSADTNKTPGIPTAREATRIGSAVVVYVDGADTDAVGNYYKLVTGGVPGSEVTIAARGGGSARFGSFNVTAHATNALNYRIYSKNSSGVESEYLDFWVPPYDIYAEQAELDAEIDALVVYVDAADDDGIDAAEARTILEMTRRIEDEWTELTAEKNDTLAKFYLPSTESTNLTNAYNSYDSSVTALLSAITTAVADDEVSAGEASSIDAAYATYATARATYRTRFTQAIDAIRGRGTQAAYKPTGQLSLVMVSDTVAEATLSLTDTLLRMVPGSLEFAKKEGQGADTGWVSTWDSSAGTAGTDINLTRVEQIAIVLGVESKFRWRAFYYDHDNNQKPLGDTVSVSNLKGVRKEIIIPFAMFERVGTGGAGTNAIQTNMDSGMPSNRGPVSDGIASEDYAPLVLPVGVIIREAYAYGYRTVVGDDFDFFIYRIAYNSAPTAIASTVSHSTTGWQKVDLGPLNETVPSDTFYHIMLVMTEASGRNTCTHRGARIFYDVDAYVKTY
jgi:hypothetical protein